MLDNKLILSSLELTGKKMEDMNEITYGREGKSYGKIILVFSIEKFCYYLLSDEFIDTYTIKTNGLHCYYKGIAPETCSKFGRAIYEYQLGNESPLIELLKII